MSNENLPITVRENLGELYRVFRDYALLYSKGTVEAGRHLAHNVSLYSYKELRKNTPAKGSIRANNLARMASSRPKMRLKIRERFMRNIPKWSDRVRAELAQREQARFFTPASMLFKRIRRGGTSYSVLRGGQSAGQASERLNQRDADTGQTTTLLWGGAVSKWSVMAANSLSAPKNMNRIADGIERARKDMLQYMVNRQRKIAGSVTRAIASPA